MQDLLNSITLLTVSVAEAKNETDRAAFQAQLDLCYSLLQTI